MLIRREAEPMAVLCADFVFQDALAEWAFWARNQSIWFAKKTSRTVKTMTAQYIEGHQSSWNELLHEVTLAVNSSVAGSTGFTPARLPAALYDERNGAADGAED
ncbi:hypothetical protein AWZ03_014822 [Drosophila navojoa]|uniref:Uncharacterized protein n=1 Tax=Drosophila navojoa TaxID=7232 RepID=A0A484AQJ8_DRONA|nr:hypothetical protein AWZ03_014822 [Drosophila navojoa]